MSQLPLERVFHGFWVDYAHRSVLGATITTTSNASNIAVAVVSILIAFAGSHLWDIIAYTSFAVSAKSSNQEETYHQRQFLLRNVDSPATFLVKATKLYWNWRKITPYRRSFARLILLAIIATLCSIGFLTAGVLASQVVSTTNIDVLVQSKYCGFTDQSILATTGVSSYAFTAVQESVRYVHDCYNASASDPACRIYQTKSIPFNTTYDVCPFEGLCTLKENQALRMDTGLLWSDDIFGINTHRSSALAIRQVTTCAPLNLTTYTKTAPMDDLHSNLLLEREPLPGESMITLDIGSWPGLAYNNTIVWSSAAINTLNVYSLNVAGWWSAALKLFQGSPWAIGATFSPINPLRSTKGDLSVISVGSNRLFYTSPVDDPFFAAHNAKDFTSWSGLEDHNFTIYSADEPAGNMGCVQQYQFCTPKNSCTSLTYLNSAGSEVISFTLDPIQNVTLYAFMNALINFSAGFYSLVYVPAIPLLASDGGNRAITPGLPPNQWELEVKYWTAIVLTTIQKLVTDVAAGQGISGERFDSQINLPPGSYEGVLCHAQKMKAPNGVSNINVFGLSFTIGLCGVIILTNITLPSILYWISSTRRHRWTFVKQWYDQELLEFQRAAHKPDGTMHTIQSIQVVAGNKPTPGQVPASIAQVTTNTIQGTTRSGQVSTSSTTSTQLPPTTNWNI